MVKIKPLKITFESLDDFAARTMLEIQDAIENEVKYIQKKDVQIWASVEAYQKFMSDQKYSILAAIYKHRPSSVYQLAKILDRAQQNVARDCEFLAGHGFIRFSKSTAGRQTKAPRLAFDYNAILVCLPSVSYRVEFEQAA
jgi:predicted transcriptional regulator